MSFFFFPPSPFSLNVCLKYIPRVQCPARRFVSNNISGYVASIFSISLYLSCYHCTCVSFLLFLPSSLSFSFSSIYSSPPPIVRPFFLSPSLCVSLDSPPWNSHWHTSSYTISFSFPSRANLLPLVVVLPRPSPPPLSCATRSYSRHYHDAVALQNNLRCTSSSLTSSSSSSSSSTSFPSSLLSLAYKDAVVDCLCIAVFRACPQTVLPPATRPTDLPIRLTFVYFRWQCSCTLHSLIADDDELFPKRYSHVYIATLFPFSWDRTRCSGLFVRYCTVNSGDFYRRGRARLVPLVDP